MEKTNKEYHEKTIKIIGILQLTNLEVAKIINRYHITVHNKLNAKKEKSYFTKDEYEMILNYNKQKQLLINNIEVL